MTEETRKRHRKPDRSWKSSDCLIHTSICAGTGTIRTMASNAGLEAGEISLNSPAWVSDRTRSFSIPCRPSAFGPTSGKNWSHLRGDAGQFTRKKHAFSHERTQRSQRHFLCALCVLSWLKQRYSGCLQTPATEDKIVAIDPFLNFPSRSGYDERTCGDDSGCQPYGPWSNGRQRRRATRGRAFRRPGDDRGTASRRDALCSARRRVAAGPFFSRRG